MKVKIGELAKMTECPVVTIRFYEKEGLLSKPERTQGNYRLYGDQDIERLRFIKHCRRHGIKLSEIRELLAFKDKPGTNCDWINHLVAQHIANVTAQIDSLVLLKEHLESLYQQCSGGRHAECGILESLADEKGCRYCEDLRCHMGKFTGEGGMGRG